MKHIWSLLLFVHTICNHLDKEPSLQSRFWFWWILPWFDNDHLQDHQKDLHLDKENCEFEFYTTDIKEFWMNCLYLPLGTSVNLINNFSRTAFIDWSDTLLCGEKASNIFCCSKAAAAVASQTFLHLKTHFSLWRWK